MRDFSRSFLAGLILTLGATLMYRGIYSSPGIISVPGRPELNSISRFTPPPKPVFALSRRQKNPGTETPKNSRAISPAISSFFAPWFQTMASVDPAAMQRQQILLKDVFDNRGTIPILNSPETWAMLTLSDSPRSPAFLLAANQENYRPLTDILLSHASPAGIREFSRILERNPTLINKLYARGLNGVEVIFAYKHDSDTGLEYSRWQTEVLGRGIKRPAEQLASLINLQLLHGKDIRTRMRDSKAFLTRFRRELWPIMTRLATAHGKMFEIFLDTPRIWDLLMLPEGEQLIRSKGPLVPVDLLYGFPAIGHNPYPDSMRADIIRTLLTGDETTVMALMKFRREPEFSRLVKRNLPPELLSAISRELLKAGADYPRRLKNFSRMTDSGLGEEIGPPPSIIKVWTPLYFTLWEVPRKLAHGRSPKVMEWITSIADPASFLMPVVKIGTAGINLARSLTGKKSTPANQVMRFHDRGRRLAARELGQELSSALSDRQLYSFGVTATLVRIMKKQKAIRPENIIDRSGAIRFFLASSGADSEGLRIIERYRLRFLGRGTKPMQVVPEAELNPTLINFFATTARACFDHNDTMACGRNRAGWWLLMAGGIP